MSRMRLARAAVAAAVLAPLSEAGDVYVVDQSGTEDFTSLEEALTTVPADSTVVVRAGVYNVDVTVSRSLVVVSEVGAGESVTFGPDLKITGLAAGERVVLRGLLLGTHLDLEFNDGEVWIEDCTIDGFNYSLQIEDSAAVTLRNCVVESAIGHEGESSVGMYVEGDSHVSVYESFVDGGASGGFLLQFDFGGRGPGRGIALRFRQPLRRWRLLVRGRRRVFPPPCVPSDFPTKVRLRNVDAEAGTPGPGGFQAPDTQATGGAVINQSADAARGIDTEALVLVGDPLVLSLEGAPGDQALLLYSFGSGVLWFGDFFSNLSMGTPWFVGPVLPLDGSGAASVQVTAKLPPGLQSVTLFTQPAFVGPAAVAFGTASAVTMARF